MNLEKNEVKAPEEQPAIVGVPMPVDMYLRTNYGPKLVIAGTAYKYQHYVTTTFNTKLYKYSKI